MKHKVNSMAVNTSKPNEVWYIDSKASSHMTSHEEWFSYLEKLEKQGAQWSKLATTLCIPSNMSVKFALVTSGRKGNS